MQNTFYHHYVIYFWHYYNTLRHQKRSLIAQQSDIAPMWISRNILLRNCTIHARICFRHQLKRNDNSMTNDNITSITMFLFSPVFHAQKGSDTFWATSAKGDWGHSDINVRRKSFMFHNRHPGKGKSRCGFRVVCLMLWKVAFKASRLSFNER